MVACRTWVVCFVSKMSIWLARLSRMISLNTRGSAVHLGAAFPPPTERTPERGRESFPFSSLTVRSLDRRYPQMAATRVQRFGCSQTTDLTTKQCSVARRTRTLRRTLRGQKSSGPGRRYTLGQAAAQHPLESPESPFQSTPGSPELFSVCE